MLKIGSIGCGNMGGAILEGLSKSGQYTVLGYDRHMHKMQKLHDECGMLICNTMQELVTQSDIVILAVKPYGTIDVVKSIFSSLTPQKPLISLAAGVSLERIKHASQNICPLVLVMPNTPSMVGEGCCALCFDDDMLAEDQKKNIEKMFSRISKCVILPEHRFPEFSALIGSGPAFVFYMLESMMESAIRLGFSYGDARGLLEKLFAGSIKLAELSPEIPHAKLRLDVCSPKGSTIVGMNALDKNGVRGAIIDAVLATHARAVEMSQEK